MLKLLLVFAVIVVFIAIIGLLKRKAPSKTRAGAYYLKKSLVSPAERSFLGVIEPMLPSEVRVFVKVRLEDIFGVVSGLNTSERTSARNRINRKHVDFLLVRTDDLAPVAGIELDDRSHDDADRKERDVVVDEVFKSAGLPILHVPAQKAYNPAEIKAKLEGMLS